MDTYIIVDLMLITASYFFWNKSRDKDYLWFMWISVVATLVDLAKIIFYPALPPVFLIVSKLFSIIFNFLIILIVLKILFKKSSHSNK